MVGSVTCRFLPCLAEGTHREGWDVATKDPIERVTVLALPVRQVAYLCGWRPTTLQREKADMPEPRAPVPRKDRTPGIHKERVSERDNSLYVRVTKHNHIRAIPAEKLPTEHVEVPRRVLKVE